MTPKKEAEKLIEENGDYENPINLALHVCDEIINDFEKSILDVKKSNYWKKVKLELLKIRDQT